MGVEVVYCVSYDSAEMNSLTFISEASFIKQIMEERACLFKTLVDTAKSSLKVVAPICTLLRGILKGFVSDFWDKVNCRL